MLQTETIHLQQICGTLVTYTSSSHEQCCYEQLRLGVMVYQVHHRITQVSAEVRTLIERIIFKPYDLNLVFLHKFKFENNDFITSLGKSKLTQP